MRKLLVVFAALFVLTVAAAAKECASLSETLDAPQLVGRLAYLSGCGASCYRIVDPAAGRLIATALPRRETVLLP